MAEQHDSGPLRDPDGAPTCLHVCVSCRAQGEAPGAADTAGRRLHAALVERQKLRTGDPPLEIRPVECLSACSHPCAVALSGPGRWSYVYGDLDVTMVDDILDGAALYVDSADGLVEWRLRPEPFRDGVVARVPPVR